jgi:hypothetical protein
MRSVDHSMRVFEKAEMWGLLVWSFEFRERVVLGIDCGMTSWKVIKMISG